MRIESVAAGGEIQVRHLLVHNDQASAAVDQHLININDADCLAKVYRCIGYGGGASGIASTAMAANSAILHNTIWGCNPTNNGSRGGIATSDTDPTIEANACFQNLVADVRNLAGTLDWNYTSDATGDDEGANGLANLTTANQFTNPTTTWAATDLRNKAGGALAGSSAPTRNTTTFPEIDQAANNRGVSIVGGWNVGACQYVAPGGGGTISILMPTRRSRLRRLIHH
jgi:hypothetical protein